MKLDFVYDNKILQHFIIVLLLYFLKIIIVIF